MYNQRAWRVGRVVMQRLAKPSSGKTDAWVQIPHPPPKNLHIV